MSTRILVVEDDPVSAEFLGEVLSRRYSVDCCPSLSEAKRQAMSRAYDLVLVDMHLGDGSGTDLLVWLQSDARQSSLPACIALSAELDEPLTATLRQLGCQHVLGKPLTVAQLEHAASQALGSTATSAHPDATSTTGNPDTTTTWDDDAALRALGGQRDVLARLRGLMRTDLPGQRARIVEAHARQRYEALDEELHRLRAACGFCGAAALSSACQALKHSHDAEHLHALLVAIDAVLDDDR